MIEINPQRERFYFIYLFTFIIHLFFLVYLWLRFISLIFVSFQIPSLPSACFSWRQHSHWAAMCDPTAGAVTATTTATVQPPESPPLRRRNSLPLPATPPVRTTSLELVSLKSPFSSSYTSLRDVLPSPNAAVNSPTASSVAINSGYEISIRNRLVKQAAWAYLQPMSASPGSSSAPNFLRRLCHRLSSTTTNPTSCFSFLYHHLVSGFARIFHRVLQALRGQVSTSC